MESSSGGNFIGRMLRDPVRERERDQYPALIPKSKDQAKAKNENDRQSVAIEKFIGQ